MIEHQKKKKKASYNQKILQRNLKNFAETEKSQYQRVFHSGRFNKRII